MVSRMNVLTDLKRGAEERAEDIVVWILLQISDILRNTESQDNPFATEFRLHALESFYHSCCTTSHWQQSPISEYMTYSRWLSGHCVKWTPVAFSIEDVWKIPQPNRAREIRKIASAVNASICRYREQIPDRSARPATINVEFLTRRFHNSVLRHDRIGSLFKLFGGVLAVECHIRQIEREIEFFFPQVHADLNWQYPDTDYALELYLTGHSQVEAELQFQARWDSHVSAVNEQ